MVALPFIAFPSSNKNFPVIAIIAALSVQYSNLGINTFTASLSAQDNKACLNSEFAETPPAIAMCLIPVSLLACFNFEINILKFASSGGTF